MGKSLIQQRRGKGSPTFRAPSFRYAGEAKHPSLSEAELKGKILDIIKSQGHTGPLIRVRYENAEEILLPAPEGIRVGDELRAGPDIDIKIGNILPLKSIPEGVGIYNIESHPGDGGKYARASGSSAKIVAKLKDKVVVLLPSNKNHVFRAECRAVIGTVAGSGRPEKPFLKAGKRYHRARATNKFWPSVSGTSMNAVNHPFGGKGSHTKGRPTQAPRNAPPGRKVGKIAPRRTGRK